MLVVIHACEQMYGGMHGMEQSVLMEVADIAEAELIGQDMSYEVMRDYDEIMEHFYAQAEDDGIEEGAEGYSDYISECMDDNLLYEVYVVDSNLDDFDGCADLAEELNENGWECFVERHCSQERD